jgi:putative ABC transport system permease protein
MLKNYIKIAFRNLVKHKSYSLINIIGLAMGMACVILLMLFIRFEFSYDRFHTDADDLYRIVKGDKESDTPERATAPPTMSTALKHEFPEIIEAVRLCDTYDYTVGYKNKYFKETNIIRADSTLFDVFSFTLIAGNPQKALADPRTVIISESTAKKYFSDENPVDEELLVGKTPYKVTGIFKDVPTNSHVQFDICLTMLGYYPWPEDAGELNTYFRLPANYPIKKIEDKLSATFGKYTPNSESYIGYHSYYIQHLTDIHLHSHLELELGVNQKMSTIYLFSSIAFLILIIACINFVNLATARSSQRAHEIGIRKTVGAAKQQLVFQFLGESLFLSFFAFALSLGLVDVLLPFFNTLAGRELSLSFGNQFVTVLGLLSLTILVGVFAGLYPAVHISKGSPLKARPGFQSTTKTKLSLRQGLVVVQFSISILLLIVTSTVFQQFKFMRESDPGFNKEQILSVPHFQPSEFTQNELVQFPSITEISITSSVPGTPPNSGYWSDQTNVQDNMHETDAISCDYNFTRLLDLEIIQGRNFDPSNRADVNSSFLLNESAVELFGIKKPIGHFFQSTSFIHRDGSELQLKGHIVGVVKDFHFISLHHPINPMVIYLGQEPEAILPVYGATLLVKIAAGGVPEALKAVEKQFKATQPNTPFEYSFLDQDFDAQHRNEARLSTIFGIFTAIAFSISCLGLLGLVIFSSERRTKELGVRKVLGASEQQLFTLLSKELIILVSISNIIAWPIAWHIMQSWLQNFAYRINMNLWIFVVAGSAALMIALATVSIHTIKAITTNPVEALRYE